MKHQAITAVVALAAVASASNVHRRRAHDHHNNDVAWVTDVDVKTIVDWMTVWPGNQPHATSAAVSSVVNQVAAASTVAAPTANSSPVNGGNANASNDADDSDEDCDDPTDGSGEGAVGSPASSSGNAVAGIIPATASIPSASASSAASTTFITAVKAAASAQPSAAAANSGKAVTSTSKAAAGSNSLTPGGRKAGLSGYVGIQKLDAFSELAPYISWYSDYTPNPPSVDNVKGIGMLWGASGSPCGNDVTKRLKAFESTVAAGTPDIMFGFYEPDCSCGDSSQMSTSDGVTQWNTLIKPLAQKGTKLGSPSMCKQKDETWLADFQKAGVDWDVTSVHINKFDLAGVKADIEHYASYGKPIWVSEFACVHDTPNWQPCTDQNEVNQFIRDAVQFFQNNDTVVAYGPSNGNGLGNTWPLTNAQGDLTESGQTYLNAIKGL